MTSQPDGMRIKVTTNGPYEVTGDVPLSRQIIETDEQGQSREWRQGEEYPAGATYRLCRCGQSKNKPFCDDTHLTVKFNGRERASRKPYLDQAIEIEGPAMVLTDAQVLCAFARFCDPDGQVWNLIEETDQPEKQRLVEHETGHCPAGRLVAWYRDTMKPFEPEFEPSIGLVEDPQIRASGPIWVRGGIPVEAADGTQYEVRNRVTLCRCGASQNKPFCDGTHASIRWRSDK